MLSAIVRIAPAAQPDVIGMARQSDLNVKQTTELAQAVWRGDPDFVRRLVGQARRQPSQRSRVRASWASLLHAVPGDYGDRLTALRAELAVLRL
ncbi:MAG: hypothetical protein IT340_22320 [Chloroflexi bacterium]|nr:hypothetical protein [Chloroflexota bacterium]